MSTASQPAANTNEEFHQDLIDLGNLIAKLPADHRTKFEPVMARVLDSTKRRRRILTLVQEALSQLRLDMKYLVFDLEATRRERDNYREMLEGRDGGEPPQ